MIYLHCEWLARDLDARLFLASYLLNAGQLVCIGQCWSITENLAQGENVPPGVNVFATANEYQARFMATCRQAGNRVVAMDEESLAARDTRVMQAIVHKDVQQLSDTFVFLSQTHQSALLETYPNLRGPITGTPRVELT